MAVLITTWKEGSELDGPDSEKHSYQGGVGIERLIELLKTDRENVVAEIVQLTGAHVPFYRHRFQDALAQSADWNFGVLISGHIDADTAFLLHDDESTRHRVEAGIELADVYRAWQIGADVFWKYFLRAALQAGCAEPAMQYWDKFISYRSRHIEELSALYTRYRKDLHRESLDYLRTLLNTDDPTACEEPLARLKLVNKRAIVLAIDGRTLPDTDFRKLSEAITWMFPKDQLLSPFTQIDNYWVAIASPMDCPPPLRKYLRDKNLCVGASGLVAAPSGFVKARKHAVFSARSCRGTDVWNSWDRIGPLEKLLQFPNFSRFDVRPDISLLFDQRSKYNFDVLELANALLQDTGGTAETANLLSLHQNTIYYRLATVRKTHGVDLRVTANCIELLACQHIADS